MEMLFAFFFLLCFGIGILFLKQKHFSENKAAVWRQIAAESTPYLRGIMEFIEYYLLLSEKSPLLFLTPEKIGILIADDKFSRHTAAYLSMIAKKPNNPSAHWAWFLKTEQANLGGEQGVACFARFSLQIELLPLGKEYPVIFRSLPAISREEREAHFLFFTEQFQKIYQKPLPLHVFPDEEALLEALQKEPFF